MNPLTVKRNSKNIPRMRADFDSLEWRGVPLRRYGELDEWRGDLFGVEFSVARATCGYWEATARIRGLELEGREFRSSALDWRRTRALDRALGRLAARVAGSLRLAVTVQDSSLLATAEAAEHLLESIGSSPVTFHVTV